MGSHARLRHDLVAVPSEVDGQTVFNLKDPITGTYFRLREPEYWLIRQLDGDTDCQTVADRFHARFGFDITGEAVAQFVSKLDELCFLENARSEQAVSRARAAQRPRRSLLGRILNWEVASFRPGRGLDLLVRLCRPLCRPAGLIPGLLLTVTGLAVFAAHLDTFAVDLGSILHLTSILNLLLAILVLGVVHEYGHAVACRLNGGEVPRMGLMVLYFIPAFYCDLSDAWLFPRRSQRLGVTLAGPIVQVLLFAAAVLTWRVTVPGIWINEFARILAIVCWVTFLFNFNPLIKLDGYYLLTDWLDIANLRDKAFNYFGNAIKRRLLGWPIDPVPVSARERRVYVAYSLLAGVYSVALVVYFVIILGQFLFDTLGILGLLLLTAAMVVTLRGAFAAFARGVVEHLGHMKGLLHKPIRLAVYAVVLIAAVVVLVAVPFPLRVSGDIRIRPVAEYTLVLSELGGLETRFRQGGANPSSSAGYRQLTSNEMATLNFVPTVSDGHHVTPGDTLALLASNEVTRQINEAVSLLERYENELALLKAPPRAEEVAEARAQIAAAQAAYDQSRRELARVEGLAAKNLNTARETEEAHSAEEIARAELQNRQARLEVLLAPPKPEEVSVLTAQIEQQRARLEFHRSQQAAQSITTPVAGVVHIRQDSRAVMTVADISVVEAVVPVSDFDIDLVATAQRGEVKVRSFPGTVFVGQVVYVAARSDSSAGSGRFPVVVQLDNREGLLADGMTGYGKIRVGQCSLVRLLLRRLMSAIRVEFWSWW